MPETVALPSRRRVAVFAVAVPLAIVIATAIAIGGVSGGPQPAAAQTEDSNNAYLKLFDDEGRVISGGVRVRGYEDAIEVHGWSFGSENQTTLDTFNSGGGAGKAQPKSFVFRHGPSGAWPRLLTRLHVGNSLREASLSVVRRTDRGTLEYLTYKFGPVFVVKVEESSNGGEPTQTVTLDYAGVTETHRGENAVGAVATAVGGWDYLRNEPRK